MQVTQETLVWTLIWEDPPEVRNGNPLQYSCLEISMDRGAWLATVHGATESWIWLSDFLHFFILFAPLTGSFPMWVISNVLSSRSVILSSACLNLLLKFSIFNAVILSNSKTSCFLFYDCHFLMNFSFSSCIDFLFFFNHLSVFSCSPPKFLKMIVLNSLS